MDKDAVPVVVDVESSAIVSPSGARLIPVKSVVILCNPKAGAEKGKEIGEEAKNLFEEAKVSVKLIHTKRSGHTESICRKKDLSAYDVICCVGGDGTFHEATNGLLRGKSSHIPLALIPAGTGNSFSIELGIGTDVSRAVGLILRGLCCLIDVVRIHFDNAPEKEDLYSINSIHWGLAASVTITAEKLRWMGKIRYTTASFYEFAKGEKTAAKIEFETADGKLHSYEEEFCMVIVNNIRGSGKGMTMAPEAKINDGLVDMLIIRTSSKFNLTHIFCKAYTTAPTEREDCVQYEQVRRFSITPYRSKDDMTSQGEVEEVIDVDGELAGITPFTATVLPRALNLII